MDTNSDREAVGDNFVVADILAEFRNQKSLADRAIEQLAAEDWHAVLDPEANSLAALVKHVGGNLRSRWTDFLTTDGEKPARDRDGEFEPEHDTPEGLRAGWERGWAIAFASIAALGASDLQRTITIRQEPLSVHTALLRSLAHSAHHVGQIVMLAKHARGAQWRTLSIPKRRR